MRWGGKLLLTNGVSTIEGSGGGGLSSWATIGGNETVDGIGGFAHVTGVVTNDYELRTYGAGIGFYNRVEISAARQDFDTRKVGGLLGLGNGFTFHQNILGAKLRVLGDAVYDQDKLLPQVSVGVQYKHNDRGAVISFIGGRKNDGVDFYVAATKLLLNYSLVVNGTLRMTKANQTGLLGFGGDKSNSYSPEFEGSLGYLLSRKLVVGVEYRMKPNKLSFAKEDDWFDFFAAYAINHTFSLTAAFVSLGDIAMVKNQNGGYLSLQASF